MNLGLLSDDENNPVYNIITGFKLIFLNKKNNLTNQVEYELELISLFNSIFSSRSMAHVFFYIIQEEAFTTLSLMNDVEISEPSAYRVLRKFQTMGIIEKVSRITRRPRTKRGGPRPSVWAVVGSSPEAIREAGNKHTRLSSPKFRQAEKIAQALIEEYLEPRGQVEITYRELVILVKKRNERYRAHDLAELTADSLKFKGVKVWR